MKRSIIVKKIFVFSAIFSIGICFLYLLNFISVLSVLIVLGIGLGISGIPSDRIAPSPADLGVSFGQKIRGLFKRKSDFGGFQKI